MNRFTQPIDELSAQSKEYIDLKIDQVKLKTGKSLAIISSKLITMCIVSVLLFIMLIMACIGMVFVLNLFIKQVYICCFIVSAFFALLALIVFLLRNKLFVNTLLQVFLNAFFEAK